LLVGLQQPGTVEDDPGAGDDPFGGGLDHLGVAGGPAGDVAEAVGGGGEAGGLADDVGGSGFDFSRPRQPRAYSVPSWR
jgi:hypothetical protein